MPLQVVAREIRELIGRLREARALADLEDSDDEGLDNAPLMKMSGQGGSDEGHQEDDPWRAQEYYHTGMRTTQVEQSACPILHGIITIPPPILCIKADSE